MLDKINAALNKADAPKAPKKKKSVLENESIDVK